MSQLHGKVAIVTGGAASIGKAIAARLVANGARVVIAARSREKGEAACAELGASSRFIQTDIRDDAQLARLVAGTVAAFGGLPARSGDGWGRRAESAPTLALQARVSRTGAHREDEDRR